MCQRGNASRLLIWLRAHMKTTRENYMRIADILDDLPLSVALGAATLGEVNVCFCEALLRLADSKDVTLTKPAGKNFESWVVDVVGGDIPLVAELDVGVPANARRTKIAKPGERAAASTCRGVS